MTTPARKSSTGTSSDSVRVVGRGLRARRGIRLSLRALREGVGKTQDQVADAAQMDQGDISRLEHREDFDDCQLATLRRYVEALGGELEVTARFEDKRIVIAGRASRSDD